MAKISTKTVKFSFRQTIGELVMDGDWFFFKFKRCTFLKSSFCESIEWASWDWWADRLSFPLHPLSFDDLDCRIVASVCAPMKYDDQAAATGKRIRFVRLRAMPALRQAVCLAFSAVGAFFCSEFADSSSYNSQSIEKNSGGTSKSSGRKSQHVKKESKLTRAVSNIVDTLSVFASGFAFALVHRSWQKQTKGQTDNQRNSTRRNQHHSLYLARLLSWWLPRS